jgi:hypothetical protein
MTGWSSPELKRHGRALWFGVLTGPVAWLGHLLVSYVMASLTCRRAWPGFTLFGWSGGQALMVIFTLAVLALITAAGWQAYQHWRRLRARAGWRGTGFDQWVAFSGVLLSGMFFVAVVCAGVPAVVLLPCR